MKIAKYGREYKMPLRSKCRFCDLHLREVSCPGYTANTVRGEYLNIEEKGALALKPYIFETYRIFNIYVPYDNGYGRVLIRRIRYCPMCGRKIRSLYDKKS